jgi:hypothetical protein
MRPPALFFWISVIGVVSHTIGQNAEAIVFDDGLLHIVDANNSYPLEGVVVDDGPGGVTTSLRMIDGGEIGTVFEDDLEAFGSSEIEVFGGSFGYSVELYENSDLYFRRGNIPHVLRIRDNATAEISGGAIHHLASSGLRSHVIVGGGVIGEFNTTGRSSFFVGGEITRFFRVNGDSVVQVIDINISCTEHPECNLRVSDEAYLDFYSGVVDSDFVTANSARAVLWGGTITGSLFALDDSVLYVMGSNFNYPIGDIAATSGTLTGTFGDGTPINIPFGRASTATIHLPEPRGLSSLAAGILLLAIANLRVRMARLHNFR